MNCCRRPVPFIFVSAVILLMTGCSTIRPVRNNRLGFLDRAARSASAPHSVDAARELDDQSRDTAGPQLSAAELKSVHFQWPLKQTSITSQFGQRGHEFHEGIDLRARTGTPVLAVDQGTVLYADRRIRGYGKMIVLRHRNGLATVYAHNSKLLVHRGQQVLKGQKIALSGSTGHSTGPHLHFEIRKGVAAIDPTRVLPNVATLAEMKPVHKSAVAARKPARTPKIVARHSKKRVRATRFAKRRKGVIRRTLASAKPVRSKSRVR